MVNDRKSIERQLEILREIRRRKARSSLIDYIGHMVPGFVSSWHHREICQKLEAVERGEIKRLIITLPPRHSKSMITSEHFPAWFIGRNPDKQIIAASYGADLAMDFGRKVRNAVRSEEYAMIFPGVELAADSQATGKWHTNKGGCYVAAGVGGAITGKGAHVAIVDDPIKNREDAESETARSRIWDWYRSTLYTRLMPGGAVVVIQTRWHNYDLVGQLLADTDSDDDWTVIDYPAISKDGEALWPDWYPIDELLRIKSVIGSREFSALYQQQPSGDTTMGFDDDWLKYWTPKTDGLNLYILCDPASERKKTSDFTVFMVVGLGADQNYYVVDIIRDRINLTDKCKLLFDLHRKYNPLAVGYEKYGMQTDIEHFRYVMEQKNYRFDITPLGGSMSKNDRIRRLVPLFEAGRVYLPHTCKHTDYVGNKVDMVKEFVDEYREFPVSRHDDMMDCLARIKDDDFYMETPGEINYQSIPKPAVIPGSNSWM